MVVGYTTHPALPDRQRLVSYPVEDEISTPTMVHPDHRFRKVDGPIERERINIEEFKLSEVDSTNRFETCANWRVFAQGSTQYAKRIHAFQLAAQYMGRSVVLTKSMLTISHQNRLRPLMNSLTAFVQGFQYEMIQDPGTRIYTGDLDTYESIRKELLDITTRTENVQAEPPDKFDAVIELLMPRPVFGKGESDVNQFWDPNDWEVLACTFRFEIEAWLRLAIDLGYDFRPPDDAPINEEQPAVNQPIAPPDQAEEEAMEENVEPYELDPEVRQLLTVRTLRKYRRSPRSQSPDSPTRRVGQPHPVSTLGREIQQALAARRSGTTVGTTRPLPRTPNQAKAQIWRRAHSPEIEAQPRDDANRDGISVPPPPVSSATEGPRTQGVSRSKDLVRPSSTTRVGTASVAQPLNSPEDIPRFRQRIPTPHRDDRALSAVSQFRRSPLIASRSDDHLHSSAPIPDFEVEQISRVYNREPPVVSYRSNLSNTGNRRFDDMFAPSRYGKQTGGRASLGRISENSPNVRSSTIEPYVIPHHRNRASGSAVEELPSPAEFSEHQRSESVGSHFEVAGQRHTSRPPSRDAGHSVIHSRSGEPPVPPRGPPRQGGDSDPSSSDSEPSRSGDDQGRRPPRDPRDNRPHRPPRDQGEPDPPPSSGNGSVASPPPGGDPDRIEKGLIRIGEGRFIRTDEMYFETRIKNDIVPQWDGDENTLSRWIREVQALANRSRSLWLGLGDVAPTRFKGKAADWWWSLPEIDRLDIGRNWDTLKRELRAFWMNQAWIDRMQRKALKARYQQKGHRDETPTEYYMRKYELVSMVYNFTTQQMIAEVLSKAPRVWCTLLNPLSFQSLTEFLTAIKFHEEALIELADNFQRSTHRRARLSGSYDSEDEWQPRRARFAKHNAARRARSMKVESRKPQVKKFKSKPFKQDKFSSKTQDRFSDKSSIKSMGGINVSYPFARDDSVVSKTGRTPEQAGKRPCATCGSRKHWDKECPHYEYKVNTLLAEYSAEDYLAEAEYEQAYRDSRDSSEEEGTDSEIEQLPPPASSSDESSSEEDF
jgi:hypothetical protein